MPITFGYQYYNYWKNDKGQQVIYDGLNKFLPISFRKGIVIESKEDKREREKDGEAKNNGLLVKHSTLNSEEIKEIVENEEDYAIYARKATEELLKKL